MRTFDAEDLPALRDIIGWFVTLSTIDQALSCAPDPGQARRPKRLWEYKHWLSTPHPRDQKGRKDSPQVGKEMMSLKADLGLQQHHGQGRVPPKNSGEGVSTYPNRHVQFCHSHLLGTFHCLDHLLLVLNEWRSRHKNKQKSQTISREMAMTLFMSPSTTFLLRQEKGGKCNLGTAQLRALHLWQNEVVEI